MMADALKVALGVVFVLFLLNEYMKSRFLGLWVSETNKFVLERTGLFGVKAVVYNMSQVTTATELTYQKNTDVAQDTVPAFRFDPVFGYVTFDTIANGKVVSNTVVTREGNNLRIDTKNNNGQDSGSTKTSLMAPAHLLGVAAAN